MTSGSRSVVTSPSSRPSAMSRSSRRMILPERVLGRSSAQMIRFGPRELADPLGDVLADLGDQLVVALEVALERHEGRDRLARVLVGLADHRGLGDLRVRDDRGLDLGRREAVAGDVDHVVDAADDPEVAVLVAGGRRRRRSRSRGPNFAQYVSTKRSSSLVERPQHPRPRPREREQALRVGARPPRRRRRRPRPRSRAAASPPSPASSACAPGSVVIMICAGLGLPPGVDDRAAPAADDLPVPEPGLRVDRLADRAEQPQRRTGRGARRTRRPTSCRRGSRSARCRRSSRRSARTSSHQMSLCG